MLQPDESKGHGKKVYHRRDFLCVIGMCEKDLLFGGRQREGSVECEGCLLGQTEHRQYEMPAPSG